jgi:hypothetical protein
MTEATLKMDPRAEICMGVVALVTSEGDRLEISEEQSVADAFMGVMVLANIVGIEDMSNILRMVDAGQANAAKAAAYLVAQLD